MTYFAYLDEFGHIGPYVSRTDSRYKDSPVFGLAGFVLPSEEVRGFGTWFFQRKCELLGFEIERLGGFVFYVGIRKSAALGSHNPNRLYARIFLEAIKRIDGFCEEDCNGTDNFVLILDEHEQRSALLAEAVRSMYGRRSERRRHLIEPPFHLESHRYQTLQAADWIAGLVGRLGAIWADPVAYPENEVFRRYFEHRLNRISRRSGIRS